MLLVLRRHSLDFLSKGWFKSSGTWSERGKKCASYCLGKLCFEEKGEWYIFLRMNNISETKKKSVDSLSLGSFNCVRDVLGDSSVEFFNFFFALKKSTILLLKMPFGKRRRSNQPKFQIYQSC